MVPLRSAAAAAAGMQAGEKVWARAAAPSDACWEAAKVVSSSSDRVVVDVDGAERTLPLDGVLPANPGPAVPDLTTMVVLNQATILANVRERYALNKIYTRASRMLVAVNPGHPLPELYTEGQREKSKAADFSDPRLEPHVYDTSEQAYRQLVAQQRPQSIVISGESGAGKTESIKYCMNFLVWRAKSMTDARPRGQASEELTARIMQSNPLLEAFGNAKTGRNNNSSRFGKYITLQFDESAAIVGAGLHTFLLEKSRVANANGESERSYHIFYQLIEGVLKGKKATDFRLLSLSGARRERRAAAGGGAGGGGGGGGGAGGGGGPGGGGGRTGVIWNRSPQGHSQMNAPSPASQSISPSPTSS